MCGCYAHVMGNILVSISSVWGWNSDARLYPLSLFTLGGHPRQAMVNFISVSWKVKPGACPYFLTL